MRFKNHNDETVQMVENLCLILSLGAIFIQIWTLMSAMESYLEGNYDHLGPTLVLSGIALACCALTAWTTTFDFSRSKQDKKTAD
jgi:FtsH-binding integral membrane protein